MSEHPTTINEDWCNAALRSVFELGKFHISIVYINDPKDRLPDWMQQLHNCTEYMIVNWVAIPFA